MPTLKSRLDRLEAAIKPLDSNLFLTMPLPELMARVEVILDLPGLSHTPGESYAKGYESMACELADRMGITPKELKTWLT